MLKKEAYYYAITSKRKKLQNPYFVLIFVHQINTLLCKSQLFLTLEKT